MATYLGASVELGPEDVVMTIFTDSMELYGSRLEELREQHGDYETKDAAVDFHHHLHGTTIDHMQELGYRDRKRVHDFSVTAIDNLNGLGLGRKRWPVAHLPKVVVTSAID